MELTPIIITGIIFLTIYKIIYIFVTRRERLTLIDKLDKFSGLPVSPDYVKSLRSLLNYGSNSGSFSALRWSMAAMGAGLGLIVGILLSRIPEIARDWDLVSTMVCASFFLFIGIALAVAFLIEYRLRSRRPNN